MQKKKKMATDNYDWYTATANDDNLKRERKKKNDKN